MRSCSVGAPDCDADVGTTELLWPFIRPPMGAALVIAIGVVPFGEIETFAAEAGLCVERRVATELTILCERRLRVTRLLDVRLSVDGVQTDGVGSVGGRESSFEEGARVMTGRWVLVVVGANGLLPSGDRDRDRSESGDAERLLQFRSQRSGVIREPIIIMAKSR